MNLYKATELARLESHIDSDTGEIDIAAFDNAQIALADKQRAVVAFIKNRAAMVSMVKAAAKELADKAKAMEAQNDGLRDYLLANMKTAGITEISAVDGTFKAKLYIDRDTSVKLVEGIVWPEKLCNDPAPPTPSKTKIKAAIEAGEAINGAYIIKSDRLEIK